MLCQLPEGLSAGNTATMARQSRPPVFLLTRPAEQGARFRGYDAARFGADVEIIRFSAIAAAPFCDPNFPKKRLRTLIFTSESGVAGFEHIAQTPGFPRSQMSGA